MLHEGFNIVDILKTGISAYSDIEQSKNTGVAGGRSAGTPVSPSQREDFMEKSKVWIGVGAVLVVVLLVVALRK